jgi:hypothetical protein
MIDERPARRYPASEFPEIHGIRLTPPGAAATLVNLSATGVLVECATRSLPGEVLTIHFAGTFKPATIESRVARCEVAGIAPDGSLRFQLGLAFITRIALAQDAGEAARKPPAARSDVRLAVVAEAAAAPKGPAPALRNRW